MAHECKESADGHLIITDNSMQKGVSLCQFVALVMLSSLLIILFASVSPVVVDFLVRHTV
jgi:hypothetical protein